MKHACGVDSFDDFATRSSKCHILWEFGDIL